MALGCAKGFAGCFLLSLATVEVTDPLLWGVAALRPAADPPNSIAANTATIAVEAGDLSATTAGCNL